MPNPYSPFIGGLMGLYRQDPPASIAPQRQNHPMTPGYVWPDLQGTPYGDAMKAEGLTMRDLNARPEPILPQAQPVVPMHHQIQPRVPQAPHQAPQSQFTFKADGPMPTPPQPSMAPSATETAFDFEAELQKIGQPPQRGAMPQRQIGRPAGIQHVLSGLSDVVGELGGQHNNRLGQMQALEQAQNDTRYQDTLANSAREFENSRDQWQNKLRELGMRQGNEAQQYGRTQGEAATKFGQERAVAQEGQNQARLDLSKLQYQDEKAATDRILGQQGGVDPSRYVDLLPANLEDAEATSRDMIGKLPIDMPQDKYEAAKKAIQDAIYNRQTQETRERNAPKWEPLSDYKGDLDKHNRSENTLQQKLIDWIGKGRPGMPNWKPGDPIPYRLIGM